MEKHNNRRFYSLNDFFKDEFKDKIFKVSLDGGFTCPNRDGKVAHGDVYFVVMLEVESLLEIEEKV